MDDPFVALEIELSRLFRRAHGASHEISASAHPDLDAELYSLLGYISRHPGALAKNLAAEFRLDPATVSRQLSRTETSGLIVRTADPKDSRGQTIELTEAGENAFEEARTARTVLLRATMDEWPPEDVATLARLLHRMFALEIDTGTIAATADEAIENGSPREALDAGGNDATPGATG